MASNTRARAYHRPRANTDKRPNRSPFPHLRRPIHHRHRMNPCRYGRPCIQGARQARHRQATARRKDGRLQPQGAPIRARPKQGGARLPLGQAFSIFGVGGQSQLQRTGQSRLCRPLDQQIPIALKGRTDGGSDGCDAMGQNSLRLGKTT